MSHTLYALKRVDKTTGVAEYWGGSSGGWLKTPKLHRKNHLSSSVNSSSYFQYDETQYNYFTEKYASVCVQSTSFVR